MAFKNMNEGGYDYGLEILKRLVEFLSFGKSPVNYFYRIPLMHTKLEYKTGNVPTISR